LPQGDKVLRKEDHQAFVREFIFEIKGGKHRILETVEKENTYSCRHVNSPPPKPRGVPVMSGTASGERQLLARLCRWQHPPGAEAVRGLVAVTGD